MSFFTSNNALSIHVCLICIYVVDGLMMRRRDEWLDRVVVAGDHFSSVYELELRGSEASASFQRYFNSSLSCHPHLREPRFLSSLHASAYAIPISIILSHFKHTHTHPLELDCSHIHSPFSIIIIIQHHDRISHIQQSFSILFHISLNYAPFCCYI